MLEPSQTSTGFGPIRRVLELEIHPRVAEILALLGEDEDRNVPHLTRIQKLRMMPKFTQFKVGRRFCLGRCSRFSPLHTNGKRLPNPKRLQSRGFSCAG